MAAGWFLAVPVYGDSRSGGQIAFESGLDGGIHVINSDGTGEVALTGGPWVDNSPSWSPDRSQIAFVSTRDDTNGDIFIMNGDTRELYPSWSPRGDRIAFCGDYGFLQAVWVMNLADLSRRQVSGPTLNCHGVSWSPDGSMIVFSADYGLGQYELWTVRSDGTDLLQVTQTADGEEFPDWSPLGDLIAYSKYNGSYAIFTVRPDGTGATRLTPRSVDTEDPAWSPDGSQITWFQVQDWVVCVMNADGRALHRIAEGLFPDW
jgi:Tol biopolymer transport system component